MSWESAATKSPGFFSYSHLKNLVFVNPFGGFIYFSSIPVPPLAGPQRYPRVEALRRSQRDDEVRAIPTEGQNCVAHPEGAQVRLRASGDGNDYHLGSRLKNEFRAGSSE